MYIDLRVIVDKENMPAVMKEKDIYGYREENFPSYQVKSPAAFSPDGHVVLFESMVRDAAWYHIKFTLQDMQGRNLRVDEDLTQFNELTANHIRIADLGGSKTHQFFSGIVFYWQS